MDATNRIYRLDNGLVALFEEASWSESFAIGVSFPGGSSLDPVDKAGLASLTCEMTNRGAGEYDNRSFLEEFENLGVRSSENANQQRVSFVATGLIDNWERTLELMAMQIRKPRFPRDEFESCRQIQLQEIASIEDEPSNKVGVALSQIFFPAPWGRPSVGFKETVQKIEPDDVESFHRRFYRPNEAIVAIVGRLDWNRVLEKIEALFGDWEPGEKNEVGSVESNVSSKHILSETEQTHIALGFKEVPFGAPDYWRMSAGVDVLSGGMSSRLFTEVREKRGLCYSVFASHQTCNGMGGVFCYCGTTKERAQESLDVIVGEIDKLSVAPVTPSELERVKIRSKSSLVMQRESTQRRVGAIMSDWRYFNTIRSLDEVLGKIDALTSESIKSYFASKSKRTFRLATLGVEQLKIDKERLF